MSAYARLVDDQLPERIRGLYLTGSVALDDYRPGRSDIDFVAVSDTALQPSELGVLQRIHTELRRTIPGPKLDGVYLTWPALATAPVGLSAPYCLRGQFEAKGNFAVNPVTCARCIDILYRSAVRLSRLFTMMTRCFASGAAKTCGAIGAGGCVAPAVTECPDSLA